MSAKPKVAAICALVLVLSGIGVAVLLPSSEQSHPALSESRGSPAGLTERQSSGREGKSHEREDSPEAAEEQHYRAAAYPKQSVAPALWRVARRAAARVPRRLNKSDFAPAAITSEGGAAAAAATAERNWKALGPAGAPLDPFIQFQQGELPVTSGRVTALVVSPKCAPGDCRLWMGAAGGGVWRTNDGLAERPDWTALDSGLESQSIGSLALDPSDRTHETIYAGTGEGNFSFSSNAGVGLFKSVDGGDSWSLVAGSRQAALDNSISGIAVDPTDSSVIWISTALGLRGSKDTFAGTASGTPKLGVYKSTDGGLSFDLQFEPGGDGAVGVVLDPAQHDTVYAPTRDEGVWRNAPSVDGTAGWQKIFPSTTRATVAVSSHSRVWIIDSRGAGDQGGEVFRIDNADLPSPMVTATQVSSQANGASGFCELQCDYDQTMAVDPEHPDTAWIGGQFDLNEGNNGESNGRAVLRTLDGGVTWTDMTTATAQEDRGVHADLHAIALNPSDPAVAFLGSDGGLVRTSGSFADGRAGGPQHRPCTTDRCHQLLSSIPTQIIDMNAGLNTLQFIKIAAANDRSGDVQGGTQDNGVMEFDGSKGTWSETFGGDGSMSAIDATDSRLRLFGAFDLERLLLSRHRGAAHTWTDVRKGLPSGLPAMPVVADPVAHRVLFAGAFAVWRATDVTRTGWKRIGFKQKFEISAIARNPSDRGTLWTGTGGGGLGLSRNVDATKPTAVRFTKIKSTRLPDRFVSGIAIDPKDPNRAWVSFSGFNAQGSPGLPPGHVFSVRVHGKSRAVTVRNVSSGIGDEPINDLVYDARAGDLYASTDYGVLTLPNGAKRWMRAGAGLPPTAVYTMAISSKRHLLYAGTHGRGLYTLPLGRSVRQLSR